MVVPKCLMEGDPRMYRKGEYISYSGHGVCAIADIRTMDFGTGSGEQVYYVIEPIAAGSATIYLPYDNPKVLSRMRPVLTKEEIDRIICSVRDDQILWTNDRKVRTVQFQQILSRRDTRELLMLASCLHKRKTEKGLPASELEMLHKAEGMIEQEFSFALNLRREDIGQYIRDRL